MPPGMWPATLDEFWKYWNHNIETLEITDWAKDLPGTLAYVSSQYPLAFPTSLAYGGRHHDTFITRDRDDGVHDLEEIRQIRSSVTRRTVKPNVVSGSSTKGDRESTEQTVAGS